MTGPYRTAARTTPPPEDAITARLVIWWALLALASPALVAIVACVGVGMLGDKLSELAELAHESYWR